MKYEHNEIVNYVRKFECYKRNAAIRLMKPIKEEKCFKKYCKSFGSLNNF